jgi:PAS domain S-box-containing protein
MPDTPEENAHPAPALACELASLRTAEAGPAKNARAREDLARIALDGMYGLVCVLAPDGTVVDANDPALDAGGLERRDVVGRSFPESRWWTHSPQVQARVAEAIRAAAGGAFVRHELDARAGARGTAVVTLDFSLRPVRDEAGRVAFLVAESRDISGMRRTRDLLQRELEDHAEDVERLAGELARRRREVQTALEAMRFAREQAERASAQKTSLLRLASHELRTPLSALVLQVDRLRRDAAELSPHHRDAVGRMRSAIKRLSALVESLLEHARIEAGRMTLEPEPVDPARVAADVVEELRPQALSKGLTLSAPPVGSVSHLETDPRLFRLVLLNLVSNAIKFTWEGSVGVGISATPDQHRIAVTDTGRGIPPEDQERIFEPFEQLEAIARKHTPGIGLGLALVREMVAALGGAIALESSPGRGSTFVVTLPSRCSSARSRIPPELPPS